MSGKYRFAIKFYPAEYRRLYGDEIAETATILTPRIWSLRQSASLAIAGLRARALLTSQGSAKKVWAQAFVTSFGFLQAALVTTFLAYLLGIRGDVVSIEPDPRLLLITCSLMLVSLTLRIRLWTVAVLVASQAAWLLVGGSTTGHHLNGIATTVVFALGLWWATKTTSSIRAFAPRTALILVCCGLCAAWLTGDPDLLWAIAAVGAFVAGVALIRVDPRLLTTAAAAVSLFLAMAVPQVVGSLGRDSLEALPFLAGYALVIVIVGLAAQYGIRRLHLQTAPQR